MNSANHIKKIKVLFASHSGYPWGGISTDTYSLLNSSLPHKVSLHFVETSPSHQSVAFSGRLSLINILSSAKSIFDFLKCVFNVQPQIVHISTAYGLSFVKHSIMVLLARLFNKTIVLQPHCSVSALLSEDSKIANKIWREYVFFVLNCCDVLAVLSREWNILSERVNCYLRNVPNGINLDPYKRLAEQRQQYHDPVNILFLGHIGKAKGVFDLLEAVTFLKCQVEKPFRIHLVGNPSNAEEISQVHQFIKENSLNETVIVSRAVYDEEKYQKFADADIFVLPSHSEGMPMVVIEAMAAGLPVIATQVGGIPDLIDSKDIGLLVPPRSPKLLSDALLWLINNPKQGMELGHNAYVHALKNFDIERKATLLFGYYQEALNKRLG